MIDVKNLDWREKQSLAINLIREMYKDEIGKSIYVYAPSEDCFKFIGKAKDITVKLDTILEFSSVEVNYYLDDNTCIVLERQHGIHRLRFYETIGYDEETDEEYVEIGFEDYELFNKMKKYGYEFYDDKDLIDSMFCCIHEKGLIIK